MTEAGGEISVLPEQDIFIERLHRKYFRKLTLYAISALRDPTKAQDVVQDAFHDALLHINDLMAHENPDGWLMETVKNKVWDSERAHRRYIRRFLSLDSDISEELLPSNGLMVELYESNDVIPMEKIEQTLTAEEYQLLKRLVLDKASHLEVAQEIGITVYTSQKRLERIRDKLGKTFPERRKKKKYK
jgi:RNA polymerase sigma factor (sigma-70 family)